MTNQEHEARVRAAAEKAGLKERLESFPGREERMRPGVAAVYVEHNVASCVVFLDVVLRAEPGAANSWVETHFADRPLLQARTGSFAVTREEAALPEDELVAVIQGRAEEAVAAMMALSPFEAPSR